MNRQIIKAVTAEGATTLTLLWRNGKRTRVDIAGYLDAPGYEKLKDPKVLATVAVEEWGHGVEWADGEIGIDADALYRLGKEQSGLAFPVTEFNDWLARNRLSLGAAAKALGITRRTVVYYHGGHKPIPLYIKLACIGWESLRLRNAA